jgi:hypothetical protein
MEIVTLKPQGPDRLNNHRLSIMAPQISDEMRARIIIDLDLLMSQYNKYKQEFSNALCKRQCK